MKVVLEFATSLYVLNFFVPFLEIFEQYYIGCICKYFNYDVKFIANNNSGWGVDDSTSNELGYTHLIAHTKRLEYVEQLLSSNYQILFNEVLD